MHYIIAQPTAEEACQAFFSIQSLLIPAIEESHGEMEINDLFNMIQAHMAKIWLVFERDSKKLVGAAATETTEYPRHSNLRVTFMGGCGMLEWQDDLDEAFCIYCEEHNLANVEVVGRKGFQKVLAPLGYEPAYTVLLKSVKEVYCG